MISAISPNQEGVVGTDSEEVWIHTETSAILVMSTSLLGTVLFFLIKEAYFYAGSLLVTSRCAIRGSCSTAVWAALITRSMLISGALKQIFCRIEPLKMLASCMTTPN